MSKSVRSAIVLDDCVEVPLTRGLVCYVDLVDLDAVSGINWYALPSRDTFYACTNIEVASGKYRMLRMHRMLLGTLDEELGDHIDGNGLNNRRRNLRAANSSQSNANRKLFSSNKSGHAGVLWHSRDKLWHVSINCRYVGSFKELDEAVQARRLAEEAVQQEYAARRSR